MKRKQPSKRKLSDLYVKKLKPQTSPFLVWDTYQRGFLVRVQPTGHKSWMCVYRRHGRPRWYHLGAADAIVLADARKLAGRVMYQVAEGGDPAAERAAERGRGTFAELATRYVEEYAKKQNKSWKQTDEQLKRHVLPKLGKMAATEITRADVRSMFRRIKSPTSANSGLASTSAVFSWAIREDVLKVNPCAKVEETKPALASGSCRTARYRRSGKRSMDSIPCRAWRSRWCSLRDSVPARSAPCEVSILLTDGGRCRAVRSPRGMAGDQERRRAIASGCLRRCAASSRRWPTTVRCLMSQDPNSASR